MSRWPTRSFPIAVAVVVLLAASIAGVAYVRIADVHSSPGWTAIDTDREPSAVVADVREQLRRVDHRTVTRIFRDNASSPSGPSLLMEEVYDYSDRQWLGHYQRLEPAAQWTWAQHHNLVGQFSYNNLDGDADRSLIYADDRSQAIVTGPSAGLETVGDYRPANPEIVRSEERGGFEIAYAYPFFLPFEAEWRELERTEEAVTYGLEKPGEVLAVRALLGARAVHDGTRVRLTLDRKTGRPLRVSKRRVLTYDVDREEGPDVGKRFHFRLETRFEDVGSADVSRPPWAPAPSLHGLFRDFEAY